MRVVYPICCGVDVHKSFLVATLDMLSSGEVLNPSDLLQTDMPQALRDKQRDKAIKQAVKLLVSQGIVLPENLSLPT